VLNSQFSESQKSIVILIVFKCTPNALKGKGIETIVSRVTGKDSDTLMGCEKA
jgi:hypothetical protein